MVFCNSPAVSYVYLHRLFYIHKNECINRSPCSSLYGKPRYSALFYLLSPFASKIILSEYMRQMIGIFIFKAIKFRDIVFVFIFPLFSFFIYLCSSSSTITLIPLMYLCSLSIFLAIYFLSLPFPLFHCIRTNASEVKRVMVQGKKSRLERRMKE